MASSNYYKVNEKNKTVVVDRKVTPTATDKDEISMLLAGGYKLRIKSEARAKAAKERAEKTGFGKKKAEKTAE